MRNGSSGEALFLGLITALWPAQALSQTVREKVDVHVVTVQLTARDHSGRAVEDLKREDLTLSIDGEVVSIDTFALAAGGAVVPGAHEAQPSATVPLARPAHRSRQIAILVDESGTKSFDRRDVYDELRKFLRQPASSDRLLLVARFDGSRLRVECLWTADSAGPLEAIARMREHPDAERLPTISELKDSNGTVEEVDANRFRFCRVLLEALALFPSGDAERRLVLVSGGAVLAHPQDIAGALKRESQSSIPWGPNREAYDKNDKTQRTERAQSAFALWSKAVNTGHGGLSIDDVVAKAIERGVAILPIAAEPIDRDRSTAVASADTRTRNAGASGSPSGATPLAGLLKPSDRLGVAQAMWAVAEETGGEPILSPRKTAVRLAEIADRAAYELSFRDPSASDQRLHLVEISCRKADVTIEYRRGYRIPTEEERTLDTVVARLLDPRPSADPFATALLSGVRVGERDLTRVSVRLTPPRESNPADERDLQFVGVGEKDDGERTEPVHWTEVARRVDDAPGTFEAITDLRVPYGPYHWSMAVTDVATGLTAFFYATPKE